MQESILIISKYALIILSVLILFRCLRSTLSDRYEEEVWAYFRVGKDLIPVCHWENIIGRGLSADVRVFGRGIGRTHAVLRRNDKGRWSIYDVFSKGGVWVNGERVPDFGTELVHGDLVNLGGNVIRFLDITREQREENEASRTRAGVKVDGALTLIELSILQMFLVIEHLFSAKPQYAGMIAVSFGALIAVEWICFGLMRSMHRNGFEIEILAFYLTGLGLSVAASSTPEDIYKQVILIVASVILFAFGGLWMKNLRRTRAMRIPVAILALGLLALNVVSGYSEYGATNWLSFGGYSFQPSELVKIGYIYVGAATLETLYRKKNLYSFIAFSAICVVALALIGDFGTALVFFVTFLVISFMRSGSIATVLLAVSGAGLAGFLAVTVKPYIARRFAIWGHVWEDVYDKGFQQTRAMSALASGGVIGKGAGCGWLKNIFAANTDLVFAMVAEELGLIVAVCMVLSVILMAFFAVRETRRGRSAYYGIAACAAMAMLLVQLGLNVFGSLDILPFTGVTFPFVSRGGSSLISCWMMMAYLKAADNRKDASFAVKGLGYVADYEDEDVVYIDDENEDLAEEFDGSGDDWFIHEEAPDD